MDSQCHTGAPAIAMPTSSAAEFADVIGAVLAAIDTGRLEALPEQRAFLQGAAASARTGGAEM